MMFRSRQLSRNVIALAFLASSAVFGMEEDCPAKAAADSDASDLLLLQVDKGRILANELPEHILCHTKGCEEVKAALAVIKGKQAEAKQKLDACSKARAQLQSDLAAAAKKRAEAEKGLAKCAAERAALQKELQQCAEVDRPNAEKALAQCAHDRAKLEAELRQCAVVDRPAAEKGLAQCAKERAQLEAKLKQLASGQKIAAAGGSKHRRRRRSSSLAEESAEVHPHVALVSEDADLETEDQLLSQEVAAVESELDGVDARAGRFAALLADADARQSKVEEAMTKLESREQNGQNALKKAEAVFSKLVGNLETLSKDMSKAEEEVDGCTQETEKVGADLAAQQTEQASALLQLASLMQEEHQLLHSHLQEQHLDHQARLSTQDVALNAAAAKAKDGEECDKLRAEVITAKGNLELTAGALKACLSAKKEISAKIEYVVALGEEASKGLQKCLDTKAQLKIKIKQCHDRRDLAREKLQECLDRKKVLKVQIEKCHQKRDEAREKLKACLARKAELKTKIEQLSKGPTVKRSALIEESSEGKDEVAHLHTLHAESEAELDMLLGTLEGDNQELANVVQELKGISDAEKEAVAGMGEATEESKSWSEDMQYAELDDVAARGLTSDMDLKLEDAMEKVHRVSAILAGAVKANEASGKEIDSVQKAVSLLVEKGV